MMIQINDRWRAKTDKTQWVLQYALPEELRKEEHKGKPRVWKSKSWYIDFSGLILGMMHKDMMGLPIKLDDRALGTLNDYVTTMESDIRDALKQYKEI